MTPEERAQILVTARLLRAAASIPWLAIGLTILAGAALIQRSGVSAATAAMLLGVVAIYFGIRVSFDARLFEDIAAERLTTAQLDAALGALREGKGQRSWDDRCRGARRLVVLGAMASVAQLIAMILISWL